jgi:epoxide hydrolase-like predicted phosphatase
VPGENGTLSGLLVDYGGVLTTNVWDSFRDFCEAEGLDREEVRRAFRDKPEAMALLRRLEAGELTEEEFSPLFGPIIGLGDDRCEGLVDRLFAGMQPEESMIEALRRARAAGIKTGLISNSWGRGRYDRDSFSELFDGVVISGEVGLYKPQPEIFQLGAERVGLQPSECVFVDDLRENCEGAEAIGMTAVLHRGADASLEQLEDLLGVELR